MASPSSSIAAILVSTGLFLMGNGLIGTLTPLRAHAEGFSDIAVGALGSWYFSGFVVGCFVGPHLLSRVGHIRAFAIAAALVAVCVLILPIWPDPAAWFGARAFTGFGLAILYMAVESWLNDRAGNEDPRPNSFALYRGQSQRAAPGTMAACCLATRNPSSSSASARCFIAFAWCRWG